MTKIANYRYRPVNTTDSTSQESSRGVGEGWVDSVFVWKVKQTEFAEALNVGYKRKRAVEGNCEASGLRRWKNQAAITRRTMILSGLMVLTINLGYS